jgi:hypothetical protein
MEKQHCEKISGKGFYIILFLEITSSGANADAAKIQRN